MGCTTKTPLFEAYSGKSVIPPQKDTLFCDKAGIDQNLPITNEDWREWQNQDKIIVKIKNLLQGKKLSQ